MACIMYSDANATWRNKFKKDWRMERPGAKSGAGVLRATYQSLKLELESKLEPVSMPESKLEKVSDPIDMPESKLELESQEELSVSWVLLLLSVP